MAKYNMHKLNYGLALPVYSHRDSIAFDWLYELCHTKTDLEKIAPSESISRPPVVYFLCLLYPLTDLTQPRKRPVKSNVKRPRSVWCHFD